MVRNRKKVNGHGEKELLSEKSLMKKLIVSGEKQEGNESVRQPVLSPTNLKLPISEF